VRAYFCHYRIFSLLRDLATILVNKDDHKTTRFTKQCTETSFTGDGDDFDVVFFQIYCMRQ